MKVTFTLNGEQRTYHADPDEKLLDSLRILGLTGVKRGCSEGTCGSCSVIIDGKLVTSCLVYTVSVAGADITTIEGLGTTNTPHPIQKAFVDSGAVQCGYCTPGMVLATKVLLDANPTPGEEDIRKALDGNLCRCTGYVKIIEGVEAAARALAGDRDGSDEVTR